MEAAVDLINEKGPQKFSLRALARQVDYSPAGLYEYFDSKDDIIEAVCAAGDAQLQSYILAVDKTMPMDQYLVALGEAYIHFAKQHEEQFHLMFTHVFDSPPIPYEAVGQDGTFKIIVDAAQDATAAGVVDASRWGDPVEIAYGLWSIAHGLATLQLSSLKHIDHDFQEADRRALETYVRGLAPTR